jgi:hypothetical protein
VGGLGDNPRIVSNCCWALMNLAEQLGAFDSEQAEPVQTGPLSPYYEGVVAALLRVTERWVKFVLLRGLKANSRIARATRRTLGRRPMRRSRRTLAARRSTPSPSCKTRSSRFCSGWSNCSRCRSVWCHRRCDLSKYLPEPNPRRRRPQQLERAAGQLLQRRHCMLFI